MTQSGHRPRNLLWCTKRHASILRPHRLLPRGVPERLGV